MNTKPMLCAAFLLIAGHAFAQTTPAAPPTPPTPRTPQTRTTPVAPAPPAAPAPAALAPPPPPPPAPPGPPRREGQPINVKIDLTIAEEGGAQPPIKKAVTAVVGDGYNGSVRGQAVLDMAPGDLGRVAAPLNLDAFPVILPSGKIRLSCTIQYATRSPGQDARRFTTDIRQSLVLNLESGKPLVISQTTDPIGERRVTVEVTATVLK